MDNISEQRLSYPEDNLYDFRTKQYSCIVSNPATGGIILLKMALPQKIIAIDGVVAAATSVAFNIEDRTTPDTAGIDIMAADQTSTTSGVTTTSFAHQFIPARHWLYLDISNVNGSPSQLTVTITATLQ